VFCTIAFRWNEADSSKRVVFLLVLTGNNTVTYENKDTANY